MNENFWRQKKILVTGHTGFKGSWLTLFLQSLGADVVGYSLEAPTRPNLFEIAQIQQSVPSYLNDIRDFASLRDAIEKEAPEIVFHLAAQSLVRYSYEYPLETYSTNVMGTVNLLEALRLTETARVAIIITSDKCYENQESLWGYREIDPLGGHDPYSNSKACAELVTSAYRSAYFAANNSPLSLASARAGNVIGGGDWAQDRLVPDFFRAIENRETLKVRNPNAIRPWQHVLEPLSGYLLLAEKLLHHGKDFTGSWNFGPDVQDIKPVNWIIHQLTTHWGQNLALEFDQSTQPHETQILKLDISKAKTRLNWQPRMPLEESLRYITDWHKAYLKNANMREITLQQIEAYQKLS